MCELNSNQFTILCLILIHVSKISFKLSVIFVILWTDLGVVSLATIEYWSEIHFFFTFQSRVTRSYEWPLCIKNSAYVFLFYFGN